MARLEIPSIVVHNGSSSVPGSPSMDRANTRHGLRAPRRTLSKQASMRDEECDEGVDEGGEHLLGLSSPIPSLKPPSPSSTTSSGGGGGGGCDGSGGGGGGGGGQQQHGCSNGSSNGNTSTVMVRSSSPPHTGSLQQQQHLTSSGQSSCNSSPSSTSSTAPPPPHHHHHHHHHYHSTSQHGPGPGGGGGGGGGGGEGGGGGGGAGGGGGGGNGGGQGPPPRSKSYEVISQHQQSQQQSLSQSQQQLQQQTQRSLDLEKEVPQVTSARHRNHGSKVKLLQRSHAMREDTSPPPDIHEPPPSVPPSTSSSTPSSNTLTVSQPTGGRRRLRHQGSSQGSFDGSSPCLSRDSSMEYTDSTGVDLQQFIIETLHKNQKDRMMLLKIEQELINLVKDNKRTHHKFPQMSSYQRMLVHRCAAFFGLEHNVDQSGTAVIVNKTRSTRLPEQRFREHCQDDLLMPDEPKRSILKRDSSSFDESPNFKSLDRQYSSESRRSRSFEEREEEYEKVRKRIFNQDMFLQSLSCVEGMGESPLRTHEVIMGGSRRNSQDDSRWSSHDSRHWGSTDSESSHRKYYYDNHRLRPGRLPKVESFESRDTLHPRSLRPPVFKSHSFGGYSGGVTVLSRGDSVCSNVSSSRLSKQDSTSSRLSEHSSSSGYKSQRQDTSSTNVSNTLSTTPSPTTSQHQQSCGQNVATWGGEEGGCGGQAVMWAVTDMDAVPLGAMLINPQSGQPYVNSDGSVYRYDPSNPPNIGTSSTNNKASIINNTNNGTSNNSNNNNSSSTSSSSNSNNNSNSCRSNKRESSKEKEVGSTQGPCHTSTSATTEIGNEAGSGTTAGGGSNNNGGVSESGGSSCTGGNGGSAESSSSRLSEPVGTVSTGTGGESLLLPGASSSPASLSPTQSTYPAPSSPHSPSQHDEGVVVSPGAAVIPPLAAVQDASTNSNASSSTSSNRNSSSNNSVGGGMQSSMVAAPPPPAAAVAAPPLMYPQYYTQPVDARTFSQDGSVQDMTSQLTSLCVGSGSAPSINGTDLSHGPQAAAAAAAAAAAGIPQGYILPRQQYTQPVYYMSAGGLGGANGGGGLKYVYPQYPMGGVPHAFPAPSAPVPPNNSAPVPPPPPSIATAPLQGPPGGLAPMQGLPPALPPSAPTTGQPPSQPSNGLDQSQGLPPGSYMPGGYAVLAYPSGAATPGQETGGTTYYYQLPPVPSAHVMPQQQQQQQQQQPSTLQYTLTPTTTTTTFSPIGGGGGYYGMYQGGTVSYGAPQTPSAPPPAPHAAVSYRAPTPPHTPNTQGLGLAYATHGGTTAGAPTGGSGSSGGSGGGAGAGGGGGQYVTMLPQQPQTPTSHAPPPPQLFTTFFRPPMQVMGGSTSTPPPQPPMLPYAATPNNAPSATTAPPSAAASAPPPGAVTPHPPVFAKPYLGPALHTIVQGHMEHAAAAAAAAAAAKDETKRLASAAAAAAAVQGASAVTAAVSATAAPHQLFARPYAIMQGDVRIFGGAGGLGGTAMTVGSGAAAAAAAAAAASAVRAGPLLFPRPRHPNSSSSLASSSSGLAPFSLSRPPKVRRQKSRSSSMRSAESITAQPSLDHDQSNPSTE